MEKIKVAISRQLLAISGWIKKHPNEFALLGIVLVVGAFLRLYNIGQYMTFLGDEGRDAIIVRNLLVYADPILVGPGTSIGNMYLGPLYYYFIVPALLLAGFSPVGPSILVALFGCFTIFLIWVCIRQWFPSKGFHFGALAASLLYAISPTIIIYSRSSWNPNIMPFFSLLTIYSMWKTWKQQDFKWLIVAGISFSFVLQSHYLGLVIAPVILLAWLFAFLHVRKSDNSTAYIRNSLIGLALFLFLMSPLVIFDARHDWRNTRAMTTFFTERQTTVSVKPWASVDKLFPVYEKSVTRLLTGYDLKLGHQVSVVIIVLTFVYIFVNRKDVVNRKGFILLILWLGISYAGLAAYKQELYDHYYGVIFAGLFILVGLLFQNLFSENKSKFVKIVGTFCFLVLVVSLLDKNPLKYPPNKQLDRSVAVANLIIEKSLGQPFNFTVIAERNYEGAYQYFFEKDNIQVVEIDPQLADSTIADQLFVVCELPEVLCNPTNNSKAGIANFGWSKVEEVWTVEGVIIYKLVHTLDN
jgi:4-amino-4-deoxy-L-arabinose transferase-like glycosyltransferase